jgi:hypothetical protein
MKGTALFLAIIVSLAYGLAEVSAHHPFSATYSFDEQVTIEGKVVALIVRNPHSFVHVETRDRDDHVRQWAVEWVGRPSADGAAVSFDALMVGDYLVVTGRPGRDPSTFRLLPQMIVRPRDGWRWADTAR